LTKKNCIWNWSIEQQNTFEALKKVCIMASILRIPNDKDPFKLSTNASDFATGAVLSQKDMQTNLWHPVAFFSKLLDVHENLRQRATYSNLGTRGIQTSFGRTFT